MASDKEKFEAWVSNKLSEEMSHSDWVFFRGAMSCWPMIEKLQNAMINHTEENAHHLSCQCYLCVALKEFRETLDD